MSDELFEEKKKKLEPHQAEVQLLLGFQFDTYANYWMGSGDGGELGGGRVCQTGIKVRNRSC